MGVLTIRNINICLATNRDHAEGQLTKEAERERENLEPVELHSRLNLKDTNALGNNTDYGGYQIMTPLSYVNNPVKTLGDFKLWDI